ncbi:MULTISPECIES: MFS transporter [unclassified Streptomyces]|uniref:MFS transporter n=1 Tax=unclassified Streptomyces TaxID=2593676 RepID=UPI0035E2A3E0
MTTDQSLSVAQVADEQPDEGAAGWRTAWASTLGLACGPSVLLTMSFGAFIDPLERAFGWGVGEIALGASLLSVAVMVISPVQGYLVDRLGGRRVILCSAPVFALGLMAMYFLPGSLSVFYLAWIALPVLGMGLWPVSYLRLTAGWFERRLGLALGVANSGIGVGTVLVPILTAALISAFGWRVAFLGLGVVALIAVPVAFFFLAEPSMRRTSVVQASGDTLRSAAATRPFWVVMVGFLLLGMMGSSVVVHQIPLLLDAGVAPSVANLVPVALGAAMIAARIGTGWLLDRLRVSVVMTASLICGIVSVLVFASGPNAVMGIVAAALAGFLIGAEFDVLSYLIPRYFGRLAFGKIYGITFSMFQIGAAISGSAVGMIRDSYDSYAPAMLVVAGVGVVSVGLFLSLGRYRYEGTVKIA